MEEANDTLGQEIIFETLHPEMVVMSGSQPMTPMLCHLLCIHLWRKTMKINSYRFL